MADDVRWGEVVYNLVALPSSLVAPYCLALPCLVGLSVVCRLVLSTDPLQIDIKGVVPELDNKWNIRLSFSPSSSCYHHPSCDRHQEQRRRWQRRRQVFQFLCPSVLSCPVRESRSPSPQCSDRIVLIAVRVAGPTISLSRAPITFDLLLLSCHNPHFWPVK